jgi:hypothetical protein
VLTNGFVVFRTNTFQVSKPPPPPTQESCIVKLVNVPSHFDVSLLELILERHIGGSFPTMPEIMLDEEVGEATVVFQDAAG